ncbi:MAG: N-acetyltransferase [Actinomycetota bacterium]|nr:N-acetyltransferase [Actinomycetota bacterium]
MLRPDERGPGLYVGDGVVLGEGVEIGTHVTIHDGTVVGDGCVLEDGAVLGKVPKLARRSSAAGRPAPAPARIGARVTVCSGAVLFAGASVGDEAILGDQSYVRERAVIGERTVIGRGAAVDNDVRVDARCSVQTLVYLTAFSVVEDDVFVGPCAMTTNDDTMSRHGPENALRGATLRRACRIGGGAVLVPGVEVGEEAFVAAGAVVTADVPARGFMVGMPARRVRDVADAELLERWR